MIPVCLFHIGAEAGKSTGLRDPILKLPDGSILLFLQVQVYVLNGRHELHIFLPIGLYKLIADNARRVLPQFDVDLETHLELEEYEDCHRREKDYGHCEDASLHLGVSCHTSVEPQNVGGILYFFHFNVDTVAVESLLLKRRLLTFPLQKGAVEGIWNDKLLEFFIFDLCQLFFYFNYIVKLCLA